MSKNSEIAEKIKQLRKTLKESQERFGKRFDVEQVTVSRWERGYPVNDKHREIMAALAGMTVQEFFHGPQPPRLVPIVAQVEADTFTIEPAVFGSEVSHIKLEIGDQEQVSVRVKGDRLLPFHHDGDILIGTRLYGADIAQALRKECIIMSKGRRGYVRFLHPSSEPGRYTLRSLNPAIDDQEAVEIEWAAPIKVIVRN